MSKRKSSSQNTIDTIIKINFNLTKKIINQLELFNPLENEYLLEQLEQLLEFKGKKIKNESLSNIYSEITIFQIKKIMNVLCKLELHHLIQNSDNDLKFKINKLKKEVIINDLTELEFDCEINENIEEDILEDTDLNYDNNINDEPINGEQINDEQINDDKINDEQINELNHNNESIDPTIKKSTNNNKIIEDLFPLVFEYLSIDDLINCRLVNKQFKKLSDKTNGINKLIIGEPNLDFDNFNWIYRPNFYDYFWSYNNTKIEDKDLISLKCFRTIQSLSIFNLDKNLKYLKIYDSQFQLTEISNLINLESLEFSRFYNRVSNHQQIINSNNLKFLALNGQFVQLTIPKLEKIQFNDINIIKSISNPKSIKHLITKNYNCKLKMFKNLEIIELRNMECKTMNGNLLIVFKNLKQLKINLNLPYVKYSDKTIEKSLIKILTDKIKLKKEIDIYLEGIKIENINKFNELINIANFNQSFNSRDYSYWKFVLDNYNLLDLNVSFIEFLNYSYLEKHFNNLINDLPDNFFDKFHRINRIYIYDIKDVDGLKWFVNNLKYLSNLTYVNVESLGQHFYDNLPNTIIFLNIYTEKDINFDFILKLSKLIKFEIDFCEDLFDLAFTSFLNLKYLIYFRFRFNRKEIKITRSDKFFCLDITEKAIKCYYTDSIPMLDYNGLIEECNKIRSN